VTNTPARGQHITPRARMCHGCPTGLPVKKDVLASPPNRHQGDPVLLNPRNAAFDELDARSRQIMRRTIDFFETKGKQRLKQEDHERLWYQDFLDFMRREQLMATLLTPPALAGGNADARWDTFRNCAFNELLAFYSLSHWYAWQVSVLGLGPIWMSANAAQQVRSAALLREGGIFGFGLSEKAHGADLYASEMLLTPMPDGSWRADGGKYYIGNGNAAALISVFGKNSETDEFVFFVAEPGRPGYHCLQNLINSQMYVAELSLEGYALGRDELLCSGQAAWDAALNTVNVGKFNLGWAAIGMCSHAFYEAASHAAHRHLYGKPVTAFPHVRQLMTDAFARLSAMRLFAGRAGDYLRAASREDRRYLLYNPLVKMKVTTEGEAVINLLWDVIAARGFEKETYFSAAARDIRALPKLEGTVHVNMALVVKFMANFLFQPAEFAPLPRRNEPRHDAFLFEQGPTGGLGKVRFHDWRLAYDGIGLPNVILLREQIEGFTAMLADAPPSAEQARDIDFLLSLGELLTLAAYGQLILESARLQVVDEHLLDHIFDVLVRDFSRSVLDLHQKPSVSPRQMAHCLKLLRKPASDPRRSLAVWEGQVLPLVDAYAMRP
jgi:acyl-CoA dehydrogenase